MKKLIVNSVLAALAACSANLHAQQDKHQHGIAELNLVLDGNSLQIEFESPAANIVGFEHEAESEAEISAIENATKILQESGKLFTLPAEAGCNLRDSDVELHHEDEESEEHAGHDDDHDSGHSEFHARYIFDCQNADRVTSIGFPLFENFPSVEEIHLQALTPRGQIGAEIEPDDGAVSLE